MSIRRIEQLGLLADVVDPEGAVAESVGSVRPTYTIKAFIEDICEHAGIIRVGPDTDSYGKPFDMAVAFKVEVDEDGNRFATIKALTTSSVPATLAHTRAVLNVLADRGLKGRWFRVAQSGDCEREVRPKNVNSPEMPRRVAVSTH